MRKQSAKQILSRKFYLVFVLICGAAFSFVWHTSAQMQTLSGDETNANVSNEAITVHAAGRGNPRVNFWDGVELKPIENDAPPSQSQAVNLVSADFDSDGVPDLITADESGALHFFRGNPGASYQNIGTNQANEISNGASFALTAKTFNLNFMPDFLEAGDFNADGYKDILAAAKGGNSLFLLSGDGRGNFASVAQIAVDGSITSLKTGEIGRADGQTDVAVAITNRKGAFLIVFEYPEGAFKHEPEIIKLASPANDIAIGNLDNDFYADIAVATGNILTVVQGRGQAFPWDLMPNSGIIRPAAMITTRQMPFQIAALAIGNFDNRRGEDLAMLDNSGSIFSLAPQTEEKFSNEKLSADSKKAATKGKLFLPAQADAKNLAVVIGTPLSGEESEKLAATFVDPTDWQDDKFEETLKKQGAENIEHLKESKGKLSQNVAGEQARQSLANREAAKTAFLRTLSAAPSTLGKWKLESLISDARLSGAADSASGAKLIKTRVSNSGRDDLIYLDAAANQIQILTQNGASQNSKNIGQMELISLDSSTAPLAVLPARLNGDALNDLIVLQQGASAPSIVMTAPTQVITVNTASDDSGNCADEINCSLRSAIELANIGSGGAQIVFNIGSGGAQTITLGSALPKITRPMTIDGTTQPGFGGTPLIEITGAYIMGQQFDGLQIHASNVTIRGLAINEMPGEVQFDGSIIGGNGISIESTTTFPNVGNNVIQGNYLGTDITGTVDKGNQATGLNIFQSNFNFVGGTAPGQKNLMSGNGSAALPGAGISVTAGNFNVFNSNIIGLNAQGNAKLSNSEGLFFTGFNNMFGGDGAGEGNTVSGNGEPASDSSGRCTGDGMLLPPLYDLDTDQLLTYGSTISGNRFGTDPTGSFAFGNCTRGITTMPETATVIGSTTADGRNIISDNGYDAVWCGNPFFADTNPIGFCAVTGNNIGTDFTGTIPLPNNQRNLPQGVTPFTGVVYINNDLTYSLVGAPTGTSLGGSCNGLCNLISGNYSNGATSDSPVAVATGGQGIVGIFNNFIGTNKSGNAALANNGAIHVASTISPNYAPTTIIGDYGSYNNELRSFGNLISGNRNGISCGVGANNKGDIFIKSNLIGTDTNGTFAVPNNGTALYFNTAFGNDIEVGGATLMEKNVIAGNNGDAIDAFGDTISFTNNYIGVNQSNAALGNGGNGIQISGIGNVVGGDPSRANIIQNNGRAGVIINGVFSFYNSVRGNSIYNNANLGIDLSNGANGGDGVTANDCDDSDQGANDLQNFPELNAPTYNSGYATVHGSLISTPNSRFTIDFYSNRQADPTKYGEGETYIGSLSVRTGLSGTAVFNFTSANPIDPSLIITSTATDENDNTSEFSCGAGLCDQNIVNEMREQFTISCANPIVVNTTTDDEDADPDDNNCDTNLNASGLQCSLRAAIEEADRRGNGAFVAFAIPGSGVQTITPASALPAVTSRTIIDATSQSGYNGSPLVEINGANAGAGTNGLTLNANKISVRGLAINRFSADGILIQDGSYERIESCYIGTDATGNIPRGNGEDGIGISNSQSNIIGGDSTITQNVINGNTQDGIHIFANSPNNTVTGNRIGIVVDDSSNTSQGVQAIGIAVLSSGNTIGGATLAIGTSPGNIISGNSSAGVLITGGDTAVQNNVVAGNIIGTNAAGSVPYGNYYGVYIYNNASRNTIGGTSPQMRNLISANTNAGVKIQGGDSAQFENPSQPLFNTVQNNYIGTNIGGDGQQSSTGQFQQFGVALVDTNDNQIGSAGAGNVISGNGSVGVVIQNSDPNNFLTLHNTVSGNYIGVGKDGSTPIYNKIAGVILSQNALANIIGGAGAGNVISGNLNGNGTGIGIGINLGSYLNKITGNKIGTNAAGTQAAANYFGILIAGGTLNNIGGSTAGERNIISGNQGGGGIVFSGNGTSSLSPSSGNSNKIESSFIKTFSKFSPIPAKKGKETNNVIADTVFTSNNGVYGNYIGTDITSGNAIPNAPYGVGIIDGAAYNFIGSNSDPSQRNIVSGNNDTGIFIGESGLITGNQMTTPPTNNLVQNNFIGTDNTGGSSVPNTVNGILLLGSQQTTIGGADAASRNIISGNGASGILIQNAESSVNTIDGNYIGVSTDGISAVPNQGSGISITQAAHNNAIHNNVIGNNGGNGVRISDTAGAGNLVDPNLIFANHAIGIDIGPTGHTPNDPNDADSGANNLQNYPEITSHQITGGELVVSYRIDSAPAYSNYGTNGLPGLYVEFFKADASGNQGEKFLGSNYYTLADYNGSLVGTKTVNLGDINTLGITANDLITATATDTDGNTSEFFPALQPTAASVSIGGRVLTASGVGIAPAVVTLTGRSGATRGAITNPFGYYRFDDVAAGETYVLSIRAKHYQFAPQVVNVTEELTDMNFTASSYQGKP